MAHRHLCALAELDEPSSSPGSAMFQYSVSPMETSFLSTYLSALLYQSLASASLGHVPPELPRQWAVPVLVALQAEKAERRRRLPK